jgi:hypothetical protein
MKSLKGAVLGVAVFVSSCGGDAGETPNDSQPSVKRNRRFAVLPSPSTTGVAHPEHGVAEVTRT